MGVCKFMMAGALGVLLLHSVAAAPSAPEGVRDLAGRALDPFADSAHVRVFVFIRTDCPITNRYAPELARIEHEFSNQSVDFFLVYPDASVTSQQIRNHIAQFGFMGQPLRDPLHELVKLAHAVTAPESAVFDKEGKLVYSGRIDDWWVDNGKARPMPTTHDLEDAITAAVTGEKVARPETRAVGCSLPGVK